jgi:hypothetical protein
MSSIQNDMQQSHRDGPTIMERVGGCVGGGPVETSGRLKAQNSRAFDDNLG